MIKYITVDVTTTQGLSKAEKLHLNGWKMLRQGLFTIQFCKKFPKRSTVKF